MQKHTWRYIETGGFYLVIILMCYNLVLIFMNHSLSIPACLLFTLLGILSADFLSGLTHFIADTYDFNHRTIQEQLVKPFREHHKDPIEMTQHDFIHTMGNAAIVMLPLVIITVIITRYGYYRLSIYLCFTDMFLLFTNQIHKYAHTANPPHIIRLLQHSKLILSPKSHYIHHLYLDRYYCITTGWLNLIMHKSKLYERLFFKYHSK